MMANSRNGSDPPENGSKDNRDSGDESEDESDVLEESPCGRWQKRREEVRPFFLPIHIEAVKITPSKPDCCINF